MKMHATWETSPNNALIKYWGKRDEMLFLPTNGSVSVCMDDSLTTRTTVVFSDDFTTDELWLDGTKVGEKEAAELSRVLDLLRAKAKTRTRAKVASENNFPTAAGFASSASGLAALTLASADALGLKLKTRELSIIARQGSGSASRSVFGGFVEWKRGVQKSGIDSFAMQVAPPEHWPQFKCVIAIVEREKKAVSSRAGMRQTLQTSSLFQERLRGMEAKIEECKRFILERNAPALFELVMRDAMSMHACMMDTYPPIIYLNDASRRVIAAVHKHNEAAGAIECGYTFDAGPNAHVYCLEKNVASVRKMLESVQGVQETMVSSVGSGPRKSAAHLLDEKGNPTKIFGKIK
jgi:diphosphomevalonate decarboxylase